MRETLTKKLTRENPLSARDKEETIKILQSISVKTLCEMNILLSLVLKLRYLCSLPGGMFFLGTMESERHVEKR